MRGKVGVDRKRIIDEGTKVKKEGGKEGKESGKETRLQRHKSPRITVPSR